MATGLFVVLLVVALGLPEAADGRDLGRDLLAGSAPAPPPATRARQTLATGENVKMALRYWSPMSGPCWFGVVGSCESQNTRKSCGYVTFFGLNSTSTVSA